MFHVLVPSLFVRKTKKFVSRIAVVRVLPSADVQNRVFITQYIGKNRSRCRSGCAIKYNFIDILNARIWCWVCLIWEEISEGYLFCCITKPTVLNALNRNRTSYKFWSTCSRLLTTISVYATINNLSSWAKPASGGVYTGHVTVVILVVTGLAEVAPLIILDVEADRVVSVLAVAVATTLTTLFVVVEALVVVINDTVVEAVVVFVLAAVVFVVAVVVLGVVVVAVLSLLVVPVLLAPDDTVVEAVVDPVWDVFDVVVTAVDSCVCVTHCSE